MTTDYDLVQNVNGKLNLLLNIDTAPPVGPGPFSQWRTAGSWKPTNDTAYKNFVVAAVQHYSFVNYWQVSNEPNFPVTGSFTDFAYLQQLTYGAIKSANSTATVLLGGVAGNMTDTSQSGLVDKSYEPILNALNGNYVDVFDFHYYGDAKCGTTKTSDGSTLLGYRSVKQVYDYFRGQLSTNNFSATLPIWITEMGTFSGTVNVKPGLTTETITQTETEQARDMIKRFVYPISVGVKKIFWAFGIYEGFGAWDNDFFDHTGIIYGGQDGTHAKGVKKLAYYTFKLLNTKLAGSAWNNVPEVADPTNKIYYYTFMQKNGKPIYVAWWDYCDITQSSSASSSKNLVINGLSGVNPVKITEGVPNVDAGSKVTDFQTAFSVSSQPVSAGSVTIPLGQNPVFIELQ